MKRSFVLLAAAAVILLAALILSHRDDRLSPLTFHLPIGAREVPDLRTDRTVTFALGGNRFAAVSDGGEPPTLFGFVPVAAAASAGPLNSSSGSDVTATGSLTWSNPSRIQGAADGSNATAALVVGSNTHWLRATNFGFAVPSTATINGIQVEWKRSSTQGQCGGAQDNAIRIVKGLIIGAMERKSATLWPSALTYASYGGSSDLWGLSWFPAGVNGTTFGAALSASHTCDTLPDNVTASVDHVRITVFYTAASPRRTKLLIFGP